MTKKFAVNILGYVVDPLGKYSADDIEKLFVKNAVMTLSPMQVTAVIAKELPEDSISIDKKKVKKRYKFTQ